MKAAASDHPPLSKTLAEKCRLLDAWHNAGPWARRQFLTSILDPICFAAGDLAETVIDAAPPSPAPAIVGGESAASSQTEVNAAADETETPGCGHDERSSGL
jgi:hypothetical protein